MADFEWFRSFVAVYRLGSISAASSSRFLTQPAVSQQLAALEAELGEPLFRRAPRQMIPTDRAKALYGQIAQAVDRLEKVNGEFRLSKRKPMLRIGGPSEYVHERVIPCLPESPYDITFTFGETKPLLQALKDNNLDLLVATQHVATSGLVFAPLARETFLLVGNRPLEALADASNADTVRRELEQAKWISYSAENPIIRRFWFEAFGVRNALTPSLIAPDLRVIRTMVAQGLGISVLPDYLVQADLQAGVLHALWSPPVPVVNDLWLAYRSSDRIDDTMMQFVEAMVRLSS